MKHLTVGVFQDDTLGRELGKTDTESDMAIFHRKLDDFIFTFMSPVEDKLSAKSQIISNVDAAIVVFSGMTRELGETIVMLDLLGVSEGIAVASPYATPDQISALAKNTSVESFLVGKRDPMKMLEVLKSHYPKRDTVSPAVVVVDHSFSVRGVGEVILGFVRKGIVRKYDKLTLLPANKEVIVRSIQIQDEDYDEADTGSRVGIAVKGATVEDMKRGSVLCAAGNVKTDTRFQLVFEKSSFYSDELREGAFHATLGMQTIPITITDKNVTSIVIESEKPISYSHDDTFLLLDLNAKKMRVIGKGRVHQN
jgi:selenocysteine-specific translation elongation factor